MGVYVSLYIQAVQLEVTKKIEQIQNKTANINFMQDKNKCGRHRNKTNNKKKLRSIKTGKNIGYISALKENSFWHCDLLSRSRWVNM